MLLHALLVLRDIDRRQVPRRAPFVVRELIQDRVPQRARRAPREAIAWVQRHHAPLVQVGHIQARALVLARRARPVNLLHPLALLSVRTVYPVATLRFLVRPFASRANREHIRQTPRERSAFLAILERNQGRRQPSV